MSHMELRVRLKLSPRILELDPEERMAHIRGALLQEPTRFGVELEELEDLNVEEQDG